MTRIRAWLMGLFVPRPPPRSLLTDPNEFVKQEKERAALRKELDAQLAFYELKRRQ